MSITFREVVGLLSACVLSGAMGLAVAGAAEEKPVTPETIVTKRFEAKATIEFQVGAEGTGAILGSSRKYGGAAGIHLCPAEQPKSDGRVLVWILMKPAHDLFRLGIDPGDPGEHFRGKVVRVTGQIARRPYNSGIVYELQVENLDQFEEVRHVKP